MLIEVGGAQYTDTLGTLRSILAVDVISKVHVLKGATSPQHSVALHL